MEKSTLNTILALALPFVLTAAFALYLRWSNRRHEAEKEALELQGEEDRRGVDERKAAMVAMAARLEDLERGQAALTAQAAPINAVFQALLIKQLTHFHTPETDALLVKLGDVNNPPTITDEEEVRLDKALEQRAKDPNISDNERDAAIALPAIIRMVKREAEAVAAGAKFADVKVVGLLPEGEDSKAE